MSSMTESMINNILEKNSRDMALTKLKILERQKYNYYAECSDGWSTEACEQYNREWDQLLEAIRKLEETA